MNFKKFIKLSAIFLLSLGIVFAVSACGDSEDDNNDGGETPVCTEHVDIDNDNKCDECGEDCTPADVEITFPVTVKDQDGIAVPDIEVVFYDSEDEVKRITVLRGASVEITLKTGDYIVMFDSVAEGYLALADNISITKSTTSLDLVVENNIPNGTDARPYVISTDTATVELAASSAYSYRIPFASGRTLVISNSAVTVEYNGNTYEPKGGKIEIVLQETDPRFPSLFKIINKSDTTNSVDITLVSPVGTSTNPIAITTLDEIINVTIQNDETVYYKWTSANDGLIVVYSDSKVTVNEKEIPITRVEINNLDTIGTQQANSESGSCYTLLKVSRGESVSIGISVTEVLGSAQNIKFIPSFYAATADAPVVIDDVKVSLTVNAGEEFYFTSASEATHLRVEVRENENVSFANSVKLNVNGTIYTADENGVIEIDIVGENFVFSLVNENHVNIGVSMFFS